MGGRWEGGMSNCFSHIDYWINKEAAGVWQTGVTNYHHKKNGAHCKLVIMPCRPLALWRGTQSTNIHLLEKRWPLAHQDIRDAELALVSPLPPHPPQSMWCWKMVGNGIHVSKVVRGKWPDRTRELIHAASPFLYLSLTLGKLWFKKIRVKYIALPLL